ncbi:MAG: Rrf2 family transcriptional regulator [Clostridiales bacterium]
MNKRAVRISQKAALALSGMTIIAAADCRPVSIRDISKILGCSEHHLVKVLQKLARKGFLVSARGPNGGFALAKPADTITMKDIFFCVEEEEAETLRSRGRSAEAVALDELVFENDCYKLEEQFTAMMEKKKLSDFKDFVIDKFGTL